MSTKMHFLKSYHVPTKVSSYAEVAVQAISTTSGWRVAERVHRNKVSFAETTYFQTHVPELSFALEGCTVKNHYANMDETTDMGTSLRHTFGTTVINSQLFSKVCEDSHFQIG